MECIHTQHSLPIIHLSFCIFQSNPRLFVLRNCRNSLYILCVRDSFNKTSNKLRVKVRRRNIFPFNYKYTLYFSYCEYDKICESVTKYIHLSLEVPFIIPRTEIKRGPSQLEYQTLSGPQTAAQQCSEHPTEKLLMPLYERGCCGDNINTKLLIFTSTAIRWLQV